MVDSKIHATQIVKKLTDAGYIAYFAGGWVRDYLMGHPSEDVDIATDAPPEKILDLFPHTILVGLAFGVVVVVIDGHQYEVATFRRDINYEGGRRPQQIELSTPREDAIRRDFTINGMFYDPVTDEVHDFVGGIEDIKKGIVRTIGDPYERFFEDRLRMIRAVRFSARFGFVIEEETQKAIQRTAYSLFPAVAMERVWQEFTKMAKFPSVDHAFVELHRLELLPTIFPALKGVHLHEIKERVKAFQHYPQRADPILYLMALFPHASEEEAEEICRYLHTSGREAKLAIFLSKLRRGVEKESELQLLDKVEWAHLYADPRAEQCLKVVAAHLEDEKRKNFIEMHKAQQESLAKPIRRIAEKNPVVDSNLLKNNGIKPGKGMGLLLKEAERISVLQNIEDPDIIVNILKQSPLWEK